MGMEDRAPSGGGYHKPIDPKKLKQIKERWKQSESIRGLSNKHHEEHEVPKAEEELMKDLEKVNGEKNPPKNHNNNH